MASPSPKFSWGICAVPLRCTILVALFCAVEGLVILALGMRRPSAVAWNGVYDLTVTNTGQTLLGCVRRAGLRTGWAELAAIDLRSAKPRYSKLLPGKTFSTALHVGAARLADSVAFIDERASVYVSRHREQKPVLLGEHDNNGSVDGVAVSCDGELVASFGDGLVYLWDVPTRSLKYRLPSASPVAFGGTPTRMFSIDQSGDLVEWDLATGETARVVVKSAKCSEVFVSHDGSYVAGYGDGNLRAWRVETGECVHDFNNPYDDISPTFTLNDRYLAWSSEYRNVTHFVELAATRPRPNVLTDYRGIVTDLAFGPDGLLYTSGTDCVVRAWNLEDRTEIWALQLN
jgi:WD40 repeat protein